MRSEASVEKNKKLTRLRYKPTVDANAKLIERIFMNTILYPKMEKPGRMKEEMLN